jgi:4a-hydroxytetrahydrobiopterin dehydratase
MSDVIKGDELEQALKKCPEWEVSEDGKEIFRAIEFEEFTEAIDCVNDIAEMAEEAQHHPDFDIRFSKVILRLTTHDEGGVTSADIEMAGRIDNLVD